MKRTKGNEHYMAANQAVSSSSAAIKVESRCNIFSLVEWHSNRSTPSVLPAMQLNAKQAFLLHPPSSDSSIAVNLLNWKKSIEKQSMLQVRRNSYQIFPLHLKTTRNSNEKIRLEKRLRENTILERWDERNRSDFSMKNKVHNWPSFIRKWKLQNTTANVISKSHWELYRSTS